MKLLLLADFYDINLSELTDSNEQILIENSFHNSPTSGNINSILVSSEILNTLQEVIKQNTLLLHTIIENQQLLMKHNK